MLSPWRCSVRHELAIEQQQNSENSVFTYNMCLLGNIIQIYFFQWSWAWRYTVWYGMVTRHLVTMCDALNHQPYPLPADPAAPPSSLPRPFTLISATILASIVGM